MSVFQEKRDIDEELLILRGMAGKKSPHTNEQVCGESGQVIVLL